MLTNGITALNTVAGRARPHAGASRTIAPMFAPLFAACGPFVVPYEPPHRPHPVPQLAHALLVYKKVF
jgi:hypothetical protein